MAHGLEMKLVGMIYAIIALLILVYLFRKGKIDKRIGYLFLLLSTFRDF